MCPAGAFSLEAASTCTNCSLGTFNNQSGLSFCTVDVSQQTPTLLPVPVTTPTPSATPTVICVCLCIYTNTLTHTHTHTRTHARTHTHTQQQHVHLRTLLRIASKTSDKRLLCVSTQ
jgi:hypothetical protein